MDGQAITYDGAGNPLSYYDGYRYTFTWTEGRRLESVTYQGRETQYEYDHNGIRTKKISHDGSYTVYDLVNGKAVGETRFSASGTATLYIRYIFDEAGSVIGISLWYPTDTAWTDYFFVKNLQGDVIQVFRASDDTLAASYTYDAWGNILSQSGDLANINPFRYRSYYYDNETWFYYLQSRYYDPAIGRFINADSYASTGKGFSGYNMFAYCGNSPIGNVDFSGHDYTAAGYDLRRLTAFMVLGAAAAVVVASNYVVKEERKQQHAVGTLQAQKKDTDYTVYFLCQANDDSKTIIYVGRVKTENFSSRMSYHQRQGRELVGSISGMDYATCRAVEQGGMMLHHTINRGNPIYNQIRGISPTNPNLDTYIKAIMNLVQFGRYPEQPLLPISYWQNFCENEFLNSCG